MISESELVAAIESLHEEALRHWVALGWVTPARVTAARVSPDVQFDPTDVARVRLICELHYDLRIEAESMPVVLSLLDQLYTVRRALGTLMTAVEAQPEEVRNRIATLVEARLGH